MGGATTDASAAGGRVAVSAGSGRDGGALELAGGAGASGDGSNVSVQGGNSDASSGGLVSLAAGSASAGGALTMAAGLGDDCGRRRHSCPAGTDSNQVAEVVISSASGGQSGALRVTTGAAVARRSGSIALRTGAAAADDVGNFFAALAQVQPQEALCRFFWFEFRNSAFALGGGLDVMAGIGSTGGDVEVSAGDSSVLAGVLSPSSQALRRRTLQPS